MMKLVYDTITSNRVQELEKLADDRIHVRGFNPIYDVPVDFRKQDWFLPFNEIPIKYCPTDRYSYLNKYQQHIKRKITWEALQGRILDEVYEQFIKKLHVYLNSTTLINIDIVRDFNKFSKEFLYNITLQICKERNNMIYTPTKEEVDQFKQLIEKTLRYETELASALLDYKISIIKDIDITSMSMILFPFVSKPSFTVNSFGITNSAQPDFLFDNKIIIDVKSPPWTDEFYNTLGGYALIYEKMNNKPMNLGMIITPEFNKKRNVPHFFNSEIILIEDIYRKTFLIRRQNLLEKMKVATDPGLPNNDSKCKSCGYYTHCWSSP